VHKRPGRPVVLSANSAGQVRTGGRPVQRLVEFHHLAEIRVRLHFRPVRPVREVQFHEAVHQTGGKEPQVPFRPGGGIPHPGHL